MTAQHKGLPVSGYRPQSQAAVDLVNGFKEQEERALRSIDALRAANDAAKARGESEPYDGRMLSIAFAGIQESFMWLNRAVFQPARIFLPEDTPDGA